MTLIQKLTILLVTTYSFDCINYRNITNKKLHDDILDYFFPMETQNSKIFQPFYLCIDDPICCRCTKICRYYGTCCIDYFFNSKIRSVDEYVHIFLKKTSVKQHVKTLPVIKTDDIRVKFEVATVPMVTSCDNKNSSYIDLCNKKDSSNDIRVIADGFIYRNKYCALCHGFKSYTFITLELTGTWNGAKFRIPDKSFKLKIHGKEILEMQRENVNVASFFPKVSEMDCSLEDRNLCYNSYFALVNSPSRFYANPHCAKCSREINLKSEQCNEKIKIKPSPPADPVPAHFRLLISFNKDGYSSSFLKIGNPICTCDQYFDIFSSRCKRKFHSICKVFNRSIKNYPHKPPVVAIDKAVARFEISPQQKLTSLFQCMKQMSGSAIYINDIFQKSGSTNTEKTITFRQYTQVSLAREKLAEVLENFDQSNNLFIVPYKNFPYAERYGFSLKHHFTNGKVCADPKTIAHNFQIDSECNINANGTIFDISNDVIYWINITNGFVNYGATHCKKFHEDSKCIMGLLNQVTSYITIKINGKEKRQIPDQYLSLADQLGICREKENKREHFWLDQYYFFERMLSLTLLSVSIILEIVLLTIYMLREHAKNIPEKNLVTFCVTLMVCDMIGLLIALTRNIIDSPLCKVMAFLLHFFSLGLCTWPCVIAYDFWTIFRPGISNYRSHVLYLKYSLVAWGIPLTITLGCVLLDLLLKGAITYGKITHGFCWIYPFYARLVVYIVPFVLMSYCSFLSVFIVIIQTKHKKRKNHSLIAKEDQLKFSKMTMKLFFLFGTAELTGLIQIPNAIQQESKIFNTIFGFIHVFLRSSRGILMFTILNCDRIREKFKRNSKNVNRELKNTQDDNEIRI